jgi:hypothetical protein
LKKVENQTFDFQPFTLLLPLPRKADQRPHAETRCAANDVRRMCERIVGGGTGIVQHHAGNVPMRPRIGSEFFEEHGTASHAAASAAAVLYVGIVGFDLVAIVSI